MYTTGLGFRRFGQPPDFGASADDIMAILKGHPLDGDFTAPVGTTDAARDMYFGDLVIPAGATFRFASPSGVFRLYFRTCLIEVGGILQWSGADSTLNVPVTAYPAGALAATLAGGAGGVGAGAAGSASGACLLPRSLALGTTYRGGAGGAGNGGAGANAGTVTLASSNRTSHGPAMLVGAGISGSALLAIAGGSGGGAGRGSGVANRGGAGGMGGGYGVIVGGTLTVLGSLRSRGGAGGNGEGTDCGGGGGGGGGALQIAVGTYGGNLPDVAGGAAGVGGGGLGVDGSVGNDGDYFISQAA